MSKTITGSISFKTIEYKDKNKTYYLIDNKRVSQNKYSLEQMICIRRGDKRSCFYSRYRDKIQNILESGHISVRYEEI